MSADKLLPPYLCACGQRFTESDYNEHRLACTAEFVELPVDPYHPQVMSSEQRRYFVEGYEQGYAAGVAAERARCVAVIEAMVKEKRRAATNLEVGGRPFLADDAHDVADAYECVLKAVRE